MSISTRVRLAIAAAALCSTVAVVGTLQTDEHTASIIQEHEGLRTKAYRDSAGVLTVCYGSTKDVKIGDVKTPQECTQRYLEDVQEAADVVRTHVTVPLTQGQFSALVSFVYNLGPTRFRSSTLLKKVNAGDCVAAGKEFLKWNKVTKYRVVQGKRVRYMQELKGLSKRRQVERNMWDSGCAAWKR